MRAATTSTAGCDPALARAAGTAHWPGWRHPGRCWDRLLLPGPVRRLPTRVGCAESQPQDGPRAGPRPREAWLACPQRLGAPISVGGRMMGVCGFPAVPCRVRVVARRPGSWPGCSVTRWPSTCGWPRGTGMRCGCHSRPGAVVVRGEADALVYATGAGSYFGRTTALAGRGHGQPLPAGGAADRPVPDRAGPGAGGPASLAACGRRWRALCPWPAPSSSTC